MDSGYPLTSGQTKESTECLVNYGTKSSCKSLLLDTEDRYDNKPGSTDH